MGEIPSLLSSSACLPLVIGNGVFFGWRPGNLSTILSMYAGWVSHTFLACRSRLTFIPRMVDISPSSVIFHRRLSPFITSSISLLVSAATTMSST